jgi:protein-S-isoprenylcysteine O-methyltransferase Ste14
LLLFIPSPPIFSLANFGENYWIWPVIIGLVITVAGQVIRGANIGLAYIIRGGRGGKVYAEELVTTGIFAHCRNPLYVGNILMLLGVGILANSLIYLLVVMPVFLFIYQAIVMAEENFLRQKFGQGFDDYSRRVNRWFPSLGGIAQTFHGMKFNIRRWILKEYNTQFIWLSGITLILFFTYPQITHHDKNLRNNLLLIIIPLLGIQYLIIRYLKKSGKMTE